MKFQTSRGRICECVIVCLLFAVFAVPALGGVQSYTTSVANYEIKYDDVFEDPDPVDILFQPTAFEAQSVSYSPPVDLTDGTLIVTVTPLPGAILDTLVFREGGDYTLSGSLVESSKAYVSATLFVDSVSVKVDGSKVYNVDLDQIVTFEKFVMLPPLPAGVDKGFWSIEAVVDVAGALAAAQIDGVVSELKFSINNTLLASSEPTSSAFIAKKHFEIEDETVPIPEPSFFALLAAGCFALVARRRK